MLIIFAEKIMCAVVFKKPPQDVLRLFTTRAATTTQRITAMTTKKGFFGFISTILKPVASTNFDNRPSTIKPISLSHSKCISKKGHKIEKRILIDEDEDDDDALAGETAFAEYPWMLEILKKNKNIGNFEYKCGGVLSKQHKNKCLSFI